jgi:hypothetical protein
MLRTFLALLAGLATIVLLVIAVTALLNRFAPDWAIHFWQRPRVGM